MTESKIHNIYLLDVNKVVKKFFDGNASPTSDIVNEIMSEHCEYNEQKLKGGVDTKGFFVKVYFYGKTTSHSKLGLFCKSFVMDDQQIVNFRLSSASSIIFVFNKHHIFMITSGQGFRIAEEYCISKFGIIVAGIFQSFKITAFGSNDISSIVHSRRTIYSDEVDLTNINSLDMVFKEITGRMYDSLSIQELLDIDEGSKKNSLRITAKNYIQFGNSLDFEGLMHILSVLDRYDFSALSDVFNLVSPIDAKSDVELINKCNKTITSSIYNAIIKSNKIDFDLFHSSTEEFINSDYYSISIEDYNLHVDDMASIELIRNAYYSYLQNEESSLELFEKFINNVKLNAIKDDETVTTDYLIKHISGEITIDGKNYYVLYGEYYYICEAYVDRLNQTLKRKLQNDIFVDEIHTTWVDTEDHFNEAVSISEKYAHLHKILENKIEFADLLKYDGDSITIVHVKDGFNGSMRALSRQVELSIKLLQDFKNNNNSDCMRRIYKRSCSSEIGNNLKILFSTEEEFIYHMKNSKIRYIIAIHTSNNDLINNRSNIAKYCLNDLISKCFEWGIELKINIIPDN